MPSAQELRDAFSKYDKNGDGFLSVDEVSGILTRPGGSKPMTENEAITFMSRFDKNSDGKLSIEEFVDALQTTMQHEVNHFNDLCNLGEVNAKTLVDNTSKRFLQDKIFTYIAELLLVVNPYKTIPGLYDLEKKQMYFNESCAKLEPHIYAIAEMSFQHMTLNAHSQSLLVMGESGAGKTETSKHLMDYLMWRAGTPLQKEGEVRNLAQAIAETNPVLEAFGNAKTIHNHNSSRFGKYVDLKFNSAYQMIGAEVRTFFLEKSRVTNTEAAQERAYHAFYQLLAGSQVDGQGAKCLKEKRAGDFHYLSLSGTTTHEAINDLKAFEKVDRAMLSCGLSTADRVELWKVCAGLLHLGNVAFKEEAKDSAAIQPETQPALAKAGELLGIGDASLLLVKKLVHSPRSNSKSHIALGLAASVAQRDALVKHVYASMFGMLVGKINDVVGARQFRTSIGILDLFGFEAVGVNSFEQLCINYANERLHRFFLMRVFDVEAELYKMQQLEVPPFGIPDNSEVLELLENSRSGVFPLLDQQCKMAEGSDRGLVEALHGAHDGRAHYSLPSKHASKAVIQGVKDEDGFVIHHYAGDVYYTAAGFLQKNSDALAPQFGKRLKKSSVELVKTMTVGVEKKRYVGKSLLSGIKQLMREVATTHPYFVRCLKPNDQLIPMEMHEPTMLRQLERSGTIQCVQLMQVGFPHRAWHQDLIKRFKDALPPFMTTARFMTTGSGQRFMTTDLPLHLFVPILFLACGCWVLDEFVLGQDAVFLKANQGGVLQDLMRMPKDDVAIKIIENAKALQHDKDRTFASYFDLMRQFVARREEEQAAAKDVKKAAAEREDAKAGGEGKKKEKMGKKGKKSKKKAGEEETQAVAAVSAPDDDKWFVTVGDDKWFDHRRRRSHRYLMMKGVQEGFMYQNFYGIWQLSDDDPSENNRPHYVHTTMYGSFAHLYHVIDPHYHVPRWIIGPEPGNADGWAFCESDAPTPHEVEATWISWDGWEWHSCKSFMFIPREHDLDGFSDDEDFDDLSDDEDLLL